MTEETLRAATVGEELQLHGGPIELVDYDPAWPELFAREAQRIGSNYESKRSLNAVWMGNSWASTPGRGNT